MGSTVYKLFHIDYYHIQWYLYGYSDLHRDQNNIQLNVRFLRLDLKRSNSTQTSFANSIFQFAPLQSS